MELRHLRYFVVVAEELHFGRAADRLHISQPPLSQQIKDLEDQLGVKLFARTSRRVELTYSGKAFLPEARGVLERAESSIRIAQLAQVGRVGRLAIGFPSSAPFLDFFDDALQTFRSSYPQVTVVMEELVSRDQVAGIVEGRLDVGFLRNPLPDIPANFTTHHLYNDSLVALIHREHPLSDRQQISVDDLKGVPLVLIHPRNNNGLNMQVMALFEEAGFAPVVAQYVAHTWTPLSLSRAQMGVGIVYASLVSKMAIQDVRQIPIKAQSARSSIYLALMKDGSPTACRFMEIVLDRVQERSPISPSASSIC